MDKEKIENLVNNIEKNLRKLAKVVNEDYISAVLIDGSFMLDSKIKDDKTQTIHCFRRIDYDRT